MYARKTRSHRREAHLVTRCEVRVAAVHLSGTSVGSAAVVSFRWVGFSFGFARRHSVRSQSTLAPTRYTHCDEACHHRRAFSLAARRSFRFVWWVSHLGLLGGLVYVRKARPHRRETRLVTRRAITDATRKQKRLWRRKVQFDFVQADLFLVRQARLLWTSADTSVTRDARPVFIFGSPTRHASKSPLDNCQFLVSLVR